MVSASLLWLVPLGWIPSLSTANAPVKSETELGELVRFKGFWIVNGDRRSRRAVFQLGPNTIQTTTSEYRENFGCPVTRFRTIQMKFSPDSKTYQARMKWTGKTIEEHRLAPWMEHQFSGIWDANAKTIIWSCKQGKQQLQFATRFISDDKHSVEIFEVNGEQILQKLAGSTFDRLH